MEMEFKDALKQLRKDKNMSQQQLANEIYVSRSVIAKWENGLGLPSENSLEALMKYFNVDRDYFFPEIKPKVIVEKNIRIRRRNIIIVIAYSVLATLFLIILFDLVFGHIRFSEFGIKNEYVDEVLKIDGYYVSVYEEYYYCHNDSDGKEVITITSSTKIKEEFKDSLKWETQGASGIVLYKRWGIFYDKTPLDSEYIFIGYKDYADHNNAGMIYQVRDSSGLYHYFYRRQPHAKELILFQENLNITINGEQKELYKNYYFTSLVDLKDSNNILTINDYELVVTDSIVYL